MSATYNIWSKSPSRLRLQNVIVWFTFAIVCLSGSGVNAQNVSDASVQDINNAAASVRSRWGQASALLGSLFIVQGGKTQGSQGGGFTYNSAPSQADMYILDLSQPFTTSSAPWQPVSVDPSGASAPAVSFHTLSSLLTSQLFLFGGDGSPTVPIQTGNDSAYLVDLSGSSPSRTAKYSTVDPAWQQPMRRIYHSADSNPNGGVWIVGGERADGSSIFLSELWNLDRSASSPKFSLQASTMPGSIVDGTSTLLSDGTLLLLGGLDLNGQLQPMDQMYSFSTKTLQWGKTSATHGSSPNTTDATAANSIPQPRRGHIAVSLPDQRIFIQGGANADLSVVYSDAWILDWSMSPPIWTELNSTGGPGPRYGHSAVAYGRQIITAFGWSGTQAADSTVYVYNGITLTSQGVGSWAGGSWSTNYTPDSQVGGKGHGNGSSSSSGDNQPTSTHHGDAPHPTDSATFPIASTNPDSGKGPSTAKTVGLVFGALIGAGLVAGVGVAVYRRRQTLNNWRRGDGSAGLLGGDGDVGDYMMEKGFMNEYDRPYHRAGQVGGDDKLTGGGGMFSGIVSKRANRRMQDRPSQAAACTAGNMGLAMEGSGPHLRERLALLAGLHHNNAQGPRFDILADEDDGERSLNCRQSGYRGRAQGEVQEPDDELASPDRDGYNAKRSSYARVAEQDSDHDIADLGQMREQHYADGADEYVASPFEGPDVREVGSSSHGHGFFASAGAALMSRGRYGRLPEDYHRGYNDDENRSDAESNQDSPSDTQHSSTGPSVQSHSNASSRSGVGSNSIKSNTVILPTGWTSFSDAAQSKRKSGGIASPLDPKPSPLIQRSPTWWDRFMTTSFLERSASSVRLANTPSADIPIRDPAPAPGLEVIAESPRTAECSEDNPFEDGAAVPTPSALEEAVEKEERNQQVFHLSTGMDELGRRAGSQADDAIFPYKHGRSLSSLNSARTTTSSQLEHHFRHMDVVQRVRTGSSRRTASSQTGSLSDTDSVALSRGSSMLRARNLEPLDESSPNLDRSASVGWGPQMNQVEELVELNHVDSLADTDAVNEVLDFRAILKPSPSRDELEQQHLQFSSEIPSLTPATTKRARLNPLLTSPFSPGTKKTRHEVIKGSVRDRVKAFEKKRPTDFDVPLPLPTSPSAKAWSSASVFTFTSSVSSPSNFSSSSTTTPSSIIISQSGSTNPSDDQTHQLSSSSTTTPASSIHHHPVRSKSSTTRDRIKYIHGLAPKPQLFIANPDRRSTSQNSLDDLA